MTFKSSEKQKQDQAHLVGALSKLLFGILIGSCRFLMLL